MNEEDGVFDLVGADQLPDDWLRHLKNNPFPTGLWRTRWPKNAFANARVAAASGSGANLAALLEEHLTDQWGKAFQAIWRAAEDAVRRAHPTTVSHWGGRSAMQDEVINRIYLVLCTTGQPYDPAQVTSGRTPSEERWLGYTAARIVLKMRTEERPHADVTKLDPTDPHMSGIDEAKELTEEMLAALPDETDRRLFKLLYIQEFSPSEAAAELKMERDTIYKRDQRLIQKLRDAGFAPGFDRHPHSFAPEHETIGVERPVRSATIQAAQPALGIPGVVPAAVTQPVSSTAGYGTLQEPEFLARARRILSGKIRADDYLLTPDELVREVEAHYQRVAEESGVVASDEARRRTLADWTLSHYYGGQLLLRRQTDQGVIVLAVGPNEVGAVEEAFGVDARSGFGREIPYTE